LNERKPNRDAKPFKSKSVGRKSGGADASGAAVRFNKNDNSFFMPDSNVTVKVNFKTDLNTVYVTPSDNTLDNTAQKGMISVLVNGAKYTESQFSYSQSLGKFYVPSTVKAGSIVTVINESSTGYVLDSETPITVKSSDASIPVEMVDRDKFTFVMPNADVTITPVYTEDLYNISTVATDKGTLNLPKQASYIDTLSIAADTIVAKPGYELDKLLVTYTDHKGIQHRDEEVDLAVGFKPVGEGSNKSEVVFEAVFKPALNPIAINYIYNGKLGGSWVDTYHREHPEQPIMGTEESSYVLSRVSPENDLGSGLLDCFGNVTMPWGSTPKGWVKFFEKRPYLAGGFMWTGFDYRGEPTPFSAANHTSAFGTIDLCGIPKPPFYYYRAWWTDEPVLKLTPHWQYRDGENATVTVYTNCPHVTLTLNGKTVGTYDVEPFEAVTVTLPFEAGVLRAVGERHGLTYTDELITPDVPSAVTATTVWKGETDEDISIVELRAVDKNGNLCPLSEQALTISLPEGQIIGVCNGNPADFGYEQQLPEERVRYLRTFGTKDSVMQVLPKKANAYKSAKQTLTYVENKDGFEDDYRLVAAAHKRTEEPTVQSFVCHVRDVSDFDYLEFERLYTNVTVYVNGVEVGNNRRSWRDTSVRYTRPYRFYCALRDGDNEIRIDADMTSDVSAPFGGIVKLGTAVQKPWEVNLHGGIARVFVRSHSPEALTADFLNK